MGKARKDKNKKEKIIYLLGDKDIWLHSYRLMIIKDFGENHIAL